MTAATDLDMDKLQAFVGKVLGDWGGFGSFRRATETPFNRIFEARPCCAPCHGGHRYPAQRRWSCRGVSADGSGTSARPAGARTAVCC